MKEKFYEILNSIDVVNGDEIIEKLEMRAGNIPDRTLTRMKTAIDFFNISPKKNCEHRRNERQRHSLKCDF